MSEIKQAIKEKIEELSFANYEGSLEGLLIIAVHKGTFKIMPAYDNQTGTLINIGLDVAKSDLIEQLKSNMVKG